MRPKIFLDTNVCINAANGEIPSKVWRRVRGRISNDFRYCISEVTLRELLIKLSRGSGSYFDQNKGPLRVLHGPSNRRFLPYPPIYALRTLLGLSEVQRDTGVSGLSEEEWANQVLETVLRSPDKQSLLRGVPIGLSRRKGRFFDLDHFDKHESEPQREFATILQGLREGRTDPPNPLTWAAWIMKSSGLVPYTEECGVLASGLSAAYRYGESLARLADTSNYSFERRSSDYGDILQLFYLCDESMHFLTLDSDFRKRTKGSAQSARIILLPDLLASLTDRGASINEFLHGPASRGLSIDNGGRLPRDASDASLKARQGTAANTNSPHNRDQSSG